MDAHGLSNSYEMLNVIQTSGILFLCMVLAYIAWKLEKALTVAVATLRAMGKIQDDLVRSQETLEDSVASVWRRIEQMESRQRTPKNP